MPFDIGLLPSAALTGLTEDQQGDLQKQATTQFLLGTLLSGDPSMGYKGAIGLPEQAMAAQQHRIALDKAQRDQAEIDAFRSQFSPKPIDAAGRSMAGGSGPTNAAAKVQTDILNTPLDIDAAQKAALGIVGNAYQPRIVESLKNMQNQFRPEMGAFTTPGGKIVGTVPLSDKSGMTRQYDQATGQWKFGTGVGAVNAVEALTGAETKARELNTPRQVTGKSGAPTFIYPQSPTGVSGVGGVVDVNPPQTANDVALQKAAETRFGDFSKSVSDASSSANDRIAAAQRMFDIADRVNGNKFTDLTAEAAAYMRGLPFVGDKFDQYVSDVKMFNVDKSKQVLSGLNNIKGNANGFEGAVVEKAASSITDPKAATKFIAALEIASADKDLAAQRFLESYNGPAGEARTKWSTSPDNPRIYNHPKVDQFLREQISANPAKPVLPAGFGLVQNKSGQYGVRKPDGSVMSLGQ